MKFIGKLLLWLAIAALLAIVLVYFMLQTRWGAPAQRLGVGKQRLPLKRRADGASLLLRLARGVD